MEKKFDEKNENIIFGGWAQLIDNFFAKCYLLFSFYFTSVLTIRVYIADGVNFFHIILLVSMFQLRKHPGYL